MYYDICKGSIWLNVVENVVIFDYSVFVILCLKIYESQIDKCLLQYVWNEHVSYFGHDSY